MSFSDVIGSVALFALVLLPLGVAWIVVTLSERKERKDEAGPTPLEMYAEMRARKNDTMRQMRAVARKNRGTTSKHDRSRR
ncbi:hypothetical protein [Streptomyces sp. PTY087I2]|uniref:hypothetical protein n=1 Tax=Streptomyces sp. PTY087I2 TaxID=1819298 RepID=UPI00080B293B|nr:hypothetical protein [Streptomyces sp. PTY087I2]OCC09539.1 hypothetical protein A3Q37_04581 [Streptomyces sp. PTY087I2]